MSALSIQVPFPVFQGRDGQPLENGYVWIGEPNLNPQTNPVVAYYDAALTIPAAQPLRTLNGYVSRAGTPAQIYVDGVNFSILVQDSKGSMVYNFPDGTGISPDACGVTYDPPFTDAVPYPVCEKLEQTVSVKDFGATGDGTTDDTAAIQAAIDYLGSITPWPVSTSRGKLRPALYFPAGVYKVSSSIAISYSSLNVFGDGGLNSLVAWYGGNTPVFDIGTFSTTPANIYEGPSNHTFENLRIQHASPGAIGSRSGQGIRSSGGGGLVLNQVSVFGFAYGINCPYGGDFNVYTNTTAEYCDVGVYQGPGGNQFYTSALNVFGCNQGVVLDRFAYAQFDAPTLNSCTQCCVLIEAITLTSTRQLSSFSLAGTSFASQLVIDTPWFEANAGELGDDFIPTHFIEVNNATATAYQGIVVNQPSLHVGNTGTKTTTSLFANTGSGAATQYVMIKNIQFLGTMTRYLTNPGNFTVLSDGIYVPPGYTAPALSNTSNYIVYDPNRRAVLSGLDPYTEDVYSAVDTRDGSLASMPDSYVIRTEYRIGSIMRMGFNFGGSFLYRFGVDIGNRRLFLGDPVANEFSIGRGAMPTTGTYAIGSFVYNTSPTVSGGKTLLGWQRLTTGSGHVLNTDWSPCYVTNT